ncbi:hypothetical protein BDZ89DRAFT_1023750 [Hymenopellis radicata]|nr:hypothetical protein BDZ89DRAFT_1023750 [Hymenopellis radicata]
MSTPRAQRRPWRGRPTRDVAGNLKQPMQYIPSVSRSSGIDKDGDALKNPGVQDEYREFIQQKLDNIPQSDSESESDSDKKLRTEAQANVIILIRKLREGIYASKRSDMFAVEVYETSLCLGILFDTPRDILSVIPHLLSELYPKNKDAPHQTLTILVSLLHNLNAGFPSQLPYRQTIDEIPHSLNFTGTEAHAWLKRLTKSLRTRNYVHFEQLTRRTSTLELLQSGSDLAQKAFDFLISKLRARARQRTWLILRSVYRELSLHAETESRRWLSRCLAFPPDELDAWIASESALGHVRKKEGAEGRWIVVKPVR